VACCRRRLDIGQHIVHTEGKGSTVRSEGLRSIDQMMPGASDGGLPLSTRPDDDEVAFYAELGWWISPKVLSDEFIDADLDAIE